MLRLLCLWVGLISAAAAETARFSVYRSEDRGRSWVRSDAGLPGDARVNAFAAVNGSVVAGTDAGIFVSRDGGRNWEGSNVTRTNAMRVGAAGVVGDRIFAAADQFILVSRDAGWTWVTNQTFPRRVVRSVLPHGNVLYVGTDADGVYRSTDLGRTWTQIAEGLPANAQVLALAGFENEVFAGLYSKGLYKLELPGEKWTRVGAAEGIKPLALAATRKTLIAGHNPGGIYWSEDVSRTWNRWRGETVSAGPAVSAAAGLEWAFGGTPISLEAPVWELGADQAIVFAGAADGVFYSEDFGRSWTRTTAGLPRVSPGVAFLVRSNFVLAATLRDYRSYSISGAEE